MAGEGVAADDDVLYSRGDPQWWKTRQLVPRGKETPVRQAVAVTQVGERPSSIQLAPPLAASTRNLKRVAPSQLHAKTRNIGQWMSDLTDRGGRRRGDLMHLWFEQIGWLEEGSPDESRLRQLAAAMQDLAPHLDGLIAHFRRMLRHEVIRETLSRSVYQQSPESIFDRDAIRQAAGVTQWRVQREVTYALVRRWASRARSD